MSEQAKGIYTKAAVYKKIYNPFKKYKIFAYKRKSIKMSFNSFDRDLRSINCSTFNAFKLKDIDDANEKTSIHNQSRLPQSTPPTLLAQKIKKIPVRIIPNQPNPSRPHLLSFKKCDLRFKPTSLEHIKLNNDRYEKSTIDTNNDSPQANVTLPLSFFQQLLQQALQNKQFKAQVQFQQKKQPIPDHNNSTIYLELLNQIHHQSKGYYPSQTTPKYSNENSILKFFIQHHTQYILENSLAKNTISSFLRHDLKLIHLFHQWITSQQPTSFSDIILICTITKSVKGDDQQQLIECFKQLYKILLFEFYSKHGYVQVMNSSDIPFTDKLKYLSMIGEILNKIDNEYYYFEK